MIREIAGKVLVTSEEYVRYWPKAAKRLLVAGTQSGG